MDTLTPGERVLGPMHRTDLPPQPKTTDALLVERKTTHGEFKENAAIAQRIKMIMREHGNWAPMSHFQREALEMIAHKMGRIVVGDANFHDHWDDIAGYAKLVSDRIPRNK